MNKSKKLLEKSISGLCGEGSTEVIHGGEGNGNIRVSPFGYGVIRVTYPTEK